MKSFKQYIIEGKYDALKKELFNSRVVQNRLSNLKKLVGFKLTQRNHTKDHYVLTFEGMEEESVDMGPRDSIDQAMDFGSFSREIDLFLEKKSNKVEAFNEKGEKFNLDQMSVFLYLFVAEVHISETQDSMREMIEIRIQEEGNPNNPSSNIVIRFPLWAAKLMVY